MTLSVVRRQMIKRLAPLLATLLPGLAMGLLAELYLGESVSAANYSRYYGGYGSSIRYGRGQTQLRRTYHNRHRRKSKSRHGSGGRGGYYRHGSVRQPSAFKSSDKYGPPMKYNPYRKRN